MTRHLKFSLFLLVVLLLAACDTTGGRGGGNCPLMPAPSTTSIEGTICDYDAAIHGTQIYAYAAPSMQQISEAYEADPAAAILIAGELDRSGSFRIALPSTLPTNVTGVICETETGPLVTSGLIIGRLVMLQEGEDRPETTFGFSSIGQTFGMRTLQDQQTQYWIYSPTTESVTGSCPALSRDPAFDVDLDLTPGWNLAVFTQIYAPGNPGDEAVVLEATLTNGTSPNVGWMFSRWQSVLRPKASN